MHYAVTYCNDRMHKCTTLQSHNGELGSPFSSVSRPLPRKRSSGITVLPTKKPQRHKQPCRFFAERRPNRGQSGLNVRKRTLRPRWAVGRILTRCNISPGCYAFSIPLHSQIQPNTLHYWTKREAADLQQLAQMHHSLPSAWFCNLTHKEWSTRLWWHVHRASTWTALRRIRKQWPTISDVKSLRRIMHMNRRTIESTCLALTTSEHHLLLRWMITNISDPDNTFQYIGSRSVYASY